jgi:hypothetical protein
MLMVKEYFEIKNAAAGIFPGRAACGIA